MTRYDSTFYNAYPLPLQLVSPVLALQIELLLHFYSAMSSIPVRALTLIFPTAFQALHI